jgi:hypothetical protein
MALSSTSRYLTTEVIEYRNVITGNLVKPAFVDLRPRFTQRAPDDRAVLYDMVESWAGLGLKYLMDANAWWVIADMSGVMDPFTELVEAKQLKVPSITRFQLNILPSDRGSF